jgi:hypothetical protein
MPSSAIVFHQYLIAVYLTLINAKFQKKFLLRPPGRPVELRMVKNEKIQPLAPDFMISQAALFASLQRVYL